MATLTLTIEKLGYPPIKDRLDKTLLVNVAMSRRFFIGGRKGFCHETGTAKVLMEHHFGER